MFWFFFVLFLNIAEDMQGKTEEEIEMMKLMGFGSFDSTKVRAESFVCCTSTRRCTLLQMDVVAFYN